MGSVTAYPLEDQEVINKTYQGYATWYSSGSRTASGEKFNPDGFSAAHRKLPFGTVLRLTNLENGNSIRVIVNDRGPFVKKYEIDVSRGAAKELGFRHRGVTKLRIEVIEDPKKKEKI